MRGRLITRQHKVSTRRTHTLKRFTAWWKLKGSITRTKFADMVLKVNVLDAFLDTESS